MSDQSSAAINPFHHSRSLVSPSKRYWHNRIPIIMSANQSVWGNSGCWGKHSNQNSNRNFGAFGQSSLQSNSLGFGAFGSNNSFSSSGPTSLPCTGFRNKESSNIYSFELNSQPGSGSASMLSLGVESKTYNWSSSGNDSWKMDTSSGGSSRTSSGHASLDWSGTVEGVFREEIQKMAEEKSSQRNVWMWKLIWFKLFQILLQYCYLCLSVVLQYLRLRPSNKIYQLWSWLLNHYSFSPPGDVDLFSFYQNFNKISSKFD